MSHNTKTKNENFSRRRKHAPKSIYSYQTLNAVRIRTRNAAATAQSVQRLSRARLSGTGVRFPAMKRFIFIPRTQTDSGTQPASYAIVTGGKTVTTVAQRSHHSSAKADNACNYTPFLNQLPLHGVVTN
jgi:hypothetical protein